MCRQNERTHKHHIIPRYKGGLDNKENLVEVTVTQHAMFHYCNYQLWGNEEDRVAWRALSGQITMDEAKYEAMAIGRRKVNEALKENLKDPEYYARHIEKLKRGFENSPHKEKIIQTLKENQSKAVEAARTPEARKNQKQKLKEIRHQQGEKNSQYGKVWITDGTKEGSYRINKEDPIPEGYRLGRVCFDTPYVWITNGKDNIQVLKDSEIPEGYWRGRQSPNRHKTP